MTPQERKLIDELFDRLASLENAPRDAGAVQAMNEGLQRAPNALYPMVQTVLVQDEALKRADARIRELEEELELQPGEPVKQPGFLDSMREALTGKPQGSVPSVRAGAPAQQSPWGSTGAGWGNTGAPPQGYSPAGPAGYGAPPPQAPGAGGGSFLGTAAATVAGVVGGALLMNSFRGMFGGGQHSGQSAFDQGSGGTPWGQGSDLSGSGLARDAGVGDIGGGGRGDYGGGSQRAGLFDSNSTSDSELDDSQEFDVGDFDAGSDTDNA